MEERHAIASEDADLFFSFLLSRDANAREREREGKSSDDDATLRFETSTREDDNSHVDQSIR